MQSYRSPFLSVVAWSHPAHRRDNSVNRGPPYLGAQKPLLNATWDPDENLTPIWDSTTFQLEFLCVKLAPSDTDQKAPPGSLSHVNSGNVSLLQQAAVWYFRNFRKDSGNIGSQAEAAVSWGITPARWWLQTCYIITTTCLNDPIWLICFMSKRLKPSSGFTVSQLFQWRYPHCMQTRGQKRKNIFIHVRYTVIDASSIHTLDTWGMQWIHVTWRMPNAGHQTAVGLPWKNMGVSEN